GLEGGRQRLADPRRATDVTHGPLTQDYGVLARRLEAEEVVEGGYAEHAAGWQPQLAGHVPQQLGSQVAEGVLRRVQDFDQRVLAKAGGLRAASSTRWRLSSAGVGGAS